MKGSRNNNIRIAKYMRKVKLLATCWLVFFICIACGQKKSNYDYQGACYENDFEKAHLIINKMKSEAEDFHNSNQLRKEKSWGGTDYSNQDKYANMVRSYLEGVDYVYNAEIRFLLQDNRVENSKRIVFLLSEMDGEIAKYQNDAVYTDIEQQAKEISIRVRENVASLADEMGNTDLSDKIKNAIPQSYENSKDVLN
jgi:hypothetical protein